MWDKTPRERNKIFAYPSQRGSAGTRDTACTQQLAVKQRIIFIMSQKLRVREPNNQRPQTSEAVILQIYSYSSESQRFLHGNEFLYKVLFLYSLSFFFCASDFPVTYLRQFNFSRKGIWRQQGKINYSNQHFGKRFGPNALQCLKDDLSVMSVYDSEKEGTDWLLFVLGLVHTSATMISSHFQRDYIVQL